MAVTYNVAVKTARMNATRTHFQNGKLELLSAADQVLAVFDLAASGGSVSGAVWTLAFVSPEVQGEAAAGVGTTATKARIKNSAGNAHLTGLTVGTSAADIVLNNTSISDGQEVEMTSATITHAD